MVSQQERARLVEHFKHEPTFLGAKFAVFLVAVGVVGFVGINTGMSVDGTRGTVQAQHHQGPAVGLTTAPNAEHRACFEGMIASTTPTLTTADRPCADPTESGAGTADAPQLPLELAKVSKKPATSPLPGRASTTETETVGAAAVSPAGAKQ